VYILGAGMHPWGKWGRDFTEYGVVAARAALADAGLDWTQVQLVAGADTIRNGYPGFVAGATFAQKLGWTGIPVSSSYAACASGSQALQSARAQILAGLCDVALVIGADTTPKGFFAPVGGERRTDPDWQRFHLIGATNTVYFALLARRRMDLYGATLEDFAAVKVKNSRHGLNNPNARYRKESSIEDVLASPVVSDPLRLLDICATSDGAAPPRTTRYRHRFHRGRSRPGTGVQRPHPRHRLRRSRDRTGGFEPGRGLRPLDGAGA
jgi:acetyl-CoA acetyltransferase